MDSDVKNMYEERVYDANSLQYATLPSRTLNSYSAYDTTEGAVVGAKAAGTYVSSAERLNVPLSHQGKIVSG